MYVKGMIPQTDETLFALKFKREKNVFDSPDTDDPEEDLLLLFFLGMSLKFLVPHWQIA